MASTVTGAQPSYVAQPRPRGGFRGGIRGRPARYTINARSSMESSTSLSVLRDAVYHQPKPAQPEAKQSTTENACTTDSASKVLNILQEIRRQVSIPQSRQRLKPSTIVEEEPECHAGTSQASVNKPQQHQITSKSVLAPPNQSLQDPPARVRKPRPNRREKTRDKPTSSLNDIRTPQSTPVSVAADSSASVEVEPPSSARKEDQQTAANKLLAQAFLSRHPNFVPDSRGSRTGSPTPTFTADTTTTIQSSLSPVSIPSPDASKPSAELTNSIEDNLLPPKRKKRHRRKRKPEASKLQAGTGQAAATPVVPQQPLASSEETAQPMAKRKVRTRGYSVAKFGPADSSTGRRGYKRPQTPLASGLIDAPKNPNVKTIPSEAAQAYKLAAKAKSLAVPTYTPLPASDVCGFSKLPAELRNQIYSLVFRGLFILDGGWSIRDLDDHPEWNKTNAPIYYQVENSRENNDIKRCLSPIHMRAHTSLMLTCRTIYEEYSQIVYSQATVAVARPRLIRRRFLTPETACPNVRRTTSDGNVPSNPSQVKWRMKPSMITNMHLKIDAYGFPIIKDRLQYRLSYYVGWQKTCQGLAETMTGLENLTLHLAKPTKLGYAGPTLVEDCTLAVEPLRDMAANGTVTKVIMKMDWDTEKKAAFAEFLERWLNGWSFLDCREALMAGKKEALDAMLKDLNTAERIAKMVQPEFMQARKDWDRLLQANDTQPEHLYRSVIAGLNGNGKTFRFFSKAWIQKAAEWEENPRIWDGLDSL